MKGFFNIYIRLVKIVDYVEAVIQFLLSPYGLRGSPARRLRLRWRARSQNAGDTFRPAKVCIFAAYQNGLDSSTKLYLAFIANLGFDIFFVNNISSSEYDREFLVETAYEVYDRKNIGRDVGALKDLYLTLLSNGTLDNCEYLVMANDSIQFIPGTFADVLAGQIRQAMADQNLGIFTHINFEIHTHYQSFFQVLHRDVFTSRAFIDFWKSYIPLSHRGHSIVNGEVLLTKTVYSKQKRILVLYSTQNYIMSLPAFISQGLIPSRGLSYLPSPATTISFFGKSWYYSDLFDFSALIELVSNALFNVGQDQHVSYDDVEIRATKQLFKSQELIELLEGSNQARTAAYLYPLVMKCPLIKKDICFCGAFPIGLAVANYTSLLDMSLPSESVDNILLKKQLVEDFELLLTRKGTPASYRKSKAQAIKQGLHNGFLYPYNPSSI